MDRATTPSDEPRRERELTVPAGGAIDLCLPGGRLDPAAVGWSRQPLHRSNLRGWGRAKRWEYWGIVTPAHAVGVTVSSLDYAGVHGAYVVDRATGEETAVDAVVPFARGVVLPGRSGVGPASARAGRLAVDIDEEPGGTRLRVEHPRLGLDVLFERPAGHESMSVVVPWSARRFQYTVKDVSRPATGTLRLGTGPDAVRHELPPGASFGVLDHGRGKWPYRITWNWAAGSGDGRGIQLGGRWTDGTGSTENALLVDGRIHKLSDDLAWDYDRADWLRPWRVTGPRVDATFHPEHVRVARTELGVVGSSTHQCFGTFTGRAQSDDGAWVPLDGLVGWAEEARQRW